MEYVINPMWFYWLQICDGLREFIIVCGVLAIVAGLTMVLIAFLDGGYYNRNERLTKIKKNTIRAIICGIICVIVSVVIPSSETLIKMKIAEFGTKDNVETVLQTINDKTDKLIEAIGKDE